MRDKASLCMLAGSPAVVSLLTGCGQKYQRVQDSLEQPINCATAREEIETLQSHKVSKSEEAAVGLSDALPTTIFVGAITGREARSMTSEAASTTERSTTALPTSDRRAGSTRPRPACPSQAESSPPRPSPNT
jgi:hypothetical protein